MESDLEMDRLDAARARDQQTGGNDAHWEIQRQTARHRAAMAATGLGASPQQFITPKRNTSLADLPGLFYRAQESADAKSKEILDLQERLQQAESDRDGYKLHAEYLQTLPELAAALERIDRLR